MPPVVHPGRLLRRELSARRLSANRLALEFFDSDWAGLLDRDIRGLLGRDWGRLEHQRGLLTLPGGRQIAGVVERLGAPLHAAPRPRADAAQEAQPESDPVAPLLAQARRVRSDPRFPALA